MTEKVVPRYMPPTPLDVANGFMDEFFGHWHRLAEVDPFYVVFRDRLVEIVVEQRKIGGDG